MSLIQERQKPWTILDTTQYWGGNRNPYSLTLPIAPADSSSLFDFQTRKICVGCPFRQLALLVNGIRYQIFCSGIRSAESLDYITFQSALNGIRSHDITPTTINNLLKVIPQDKKPHCSIQYVF